MWPAPTTHPWSARPLAAPAPPQRLYTLFTSLQCVGHTRPPPLSQLRSASVDAVPSPPPAADTLLDAAKRRLQAASSLQDYRQLVLDQPSNVHYLIAAADAESRMGADPAAASHLYAQALQQAGDCAKERSYVLVAWGMYEGTAGHTQRARDMFTTAAELAPEKAAPLNALGKVEEWEGNWRAAKALYERALALEPEHGRSLQALAVLLSKNGDGSTAVQMFKKSTKLDPGHAPGWQAWALHEWRRGRYLPAKQLFERGMELCQPHSPLLAAYAK